MVNFSQEHFNRFIIDHDVIGFFERPITLKSGRASNWYVNWRSITSDVLLSEELADFIIAYTKDKGLVPDCFYGVPEGATKLALLAQYKWAKEHHKHRAPFAMGRGKPKEHGAPQDKYFVGTPQGKTIIIEDVTTTGGSLLTTIAALKEAGIDIIAAYGITNRMERRDDGSSVQEAIKAQGVPYYSLSSAPELLPLICAKKQPGQGLIKAIEQEFEQYGVEELSLEPVNLTAKEQQARKCVCLPLDNLETLDEVRKRIQELSPYVGLFKVGKESFTRFGPAIITLIKEYGSEVFLDLKYHDIPNTVKGAAKAAAQLGVRMFNVHASGGVAMLQAAIEGAVEGSEGRTRPLVIGVTVLTSLDESAIKEVGIQEPLAKHVLRLAKLCARAGCDGIVCSAADLAMIKGSLPQGFLTITPGIQGPITAAGADQKRVMSPGQAIKEGASILVIGRAITGAATAKERRAAAKSILEDIAKVIS